MIVSSRLKSSLADLKGIADVLQLLATLESPGQLSEQALYWLGESVNDEREIIMEELAAMNTKDGGATA